MADVLGCSKCRYSERGCARCRDPAFRDRQLAKAQGNGRPIKKSKQSTKLRKRPAHTSGQDVQPERHPDSKRTRFTRKARKAQAPARGVQAGNGGVQHPSYQDVEAKEAALAAVPDTGPTSQADPRYPKTQQTGTEGAEQTQQDHRSSEQHGDSQSIAAEVAADKDKQKESKRKQPELNDGTEAETDAKAAGGGDKQVASGLELGLMAGLLPLQEVSKGSELARRSLEEPTLVGKEPDGMLAPSSDSKRVSEQEAAKPVQSTSEQSKDISQTSTGMYPHMQMHIRHTPEISRRECECISILSAIPRLHSCLFLYITGYRAMQGAISSIWIATRVLSSAYSLCDFQACTHWTLRKRLRE